MKYSPERKEAVLQKNDATAQPVHATISRR